MINENGEDTGYELQSGGAGSRCDAVGVYSRQLALAVPELPPAQDSPGPASGEVPDGMFYGLTFATTTTQADPPVGAIVYAAVQPRAHTPRPTSST